MENALAKLRKQRGLTQKGLAALASIAQSYVSRLESGECPIEKLSLDVAARLAAALGVSIEELLG
jgi:transcriptional regulator with XRE-family HTH domain